jgi:hypothetical protein
MALNQKQKSRRVLIRLTVALACVMNASSPVLTQENAKLAAEKWRPKDGIYSDPGVDLYDRCIDHTDFYVDLRKKSVGGNEWSCEVSRLSDTAPGAIRLDMTCYDYNLGISINDPNPYDRQFKETMLIRKIDEKSISVRKTVNGKFKDPDWRAAYCPKDAQRMHIEAQANNKAEAERKAGEEKSGLRGWHPRDGVYASPGADFGDRCQKSGDAIIGLAKNSVSSGAASCYVSNVADAPPYAVKLGVICNQSGAQGLVMRTVNGQTTLEPAGAETMILKKIDEQTVSLQKSLNGQFSEPAQQLSYCPEAAQRLR